MNNTNNIPNMNFDPMTGEPLNKQNSNTINNNEQNTNQTATPIPIVNNNQSEVMMQTIATVNQSQENFMANVQSENKVNIENKSEKSNYWFIIILFGIIFAAIVFLFPYLLKTL